MLENNLHKLYFCALIITRVLLQQLSDPWSAASSPPSDPWQPLGGTPLKAPVGTAMGDNSWLPRTQSPALQNSNALVEGWLQNTAMTNGNAPPQALAVDPWLVKPAQPPPSTTDPWLTKSPVTDPWLPPVKNTNPNQNALSDDPWAPSSAALNVNILFYNITK